MKPFLESGRAARGRLSGGMLPIAFGIALATSFSVQAWAAGGGGRSGGSAASGARSAAPKAAAGGVPGRGIVAGVAGTSYASKQQWLWRRPLAEGPLPSPQVGEAKQQREAGGAGWAGTALLAYPLSQPGLSPADKAWIEDKMRQQKQSDEEPLLRALASKVAFQFHGIDREFAVGKPAQFSVTVRGVPGAALLVCDYPEKAIGTFAKVDVNWTPQKAGAFLVSCRAGAYSERRLVRVL